MQCEICKTMEANVHLKQVCNGIVREVHVCQDCAAKHGFDAQSQMSLTDFLFGMAGNQQQDVMLPGDEKACPACHARWVDFKKSSRLGCAACYATFSAELGPALASMHRKDKHVGKVPARLAHTVEAASLRRALGDAVAAQNFEEAARLRDRLKDLQPEHAPAKKKAEVSKC
jgi:protein arginine kinase activator